MKKIIGLAFLGLFVLTVSCEREDAHHKHEDINVIRNIKLSDLTALQGAFSQNSNAGYRSSNTTNYFDLIDENNITVITRSNGDKTYTFSLKIAEEDKLTNLVVRELGSEYEFDLVEYSSNDLELWKTDIKNNLRSSVEVIITVTPLSGGAICITDGYVCPSGLHTSGQELQCTYSFGEWSYFLMQAPCDLSSGGGSGGGNGGGNSNGNTPPVIEEPEPYTEPVFPELTPAIADFIASQSNWNNLAPQIKTQIINYLLPNIRNNIINPQAQAFADWAVGFFDNNPNTTWGQLENYFSINDNIDYDLFNELKNLPTNTLEEFIEINDELSSFNSTIQADSFDPLNSPWLKEAREYVTRLEEWSSNLGPKAKQKANELIDKTFIYALKKTAQHIYPSVNSLNESQKQTQFQTNGNNGVAILLYEFATGMGQDERIFSLNSDIAQKLVEGDRLTAIKNNFFERLANENLTFEQFVTNGNNITGGYAFSPDHTTIEESINAHINANFVQFFIGGTANIYSPTNQYGWIKVTVSNPTSRSSLMLHIGNDYPRSGNGNNKPLSTIKQKFTFLLKVID